MKGRLIGREGRNIRAIEAATGVDLIIDDTPEAVVVSSFDPVRREVARRTIERLIEDGRIHPARIEELVEKIRIEVEKNTLEDGERAAFDLGLHGIHPEILKLIGALKYRTSYTQNQYSHVIEVGFLCGAMAAELGISVKTARRAGLLHDIGKAIDHSIEGSHAVIGADFAKKYGEHPAIVHAIRAHHEDVKPETVLAHLVMASDALSGARPGARRERMESYIQRLEDLEKISSQFEGVERAFAIQAGREVRVLVESEKVSDEQATVLSNDIAKRIEEELTYPGQIRIMVIRETRAMGLAK
jgi:ribonuclease Y